MKLDAHQHFWSYDAAQYPWIKPGSPLHRDWLPQDLEPLLAAAGLDGCIAVQARQTVEESRWLLTLADHAPIIKGVVGWVDLRSEKVGEQLEELAQHPRFRGVRHVVQDEADDRFLLGAEFQRGLVQLVGYGLSYDLLIYPRQLPAAIQLVRRFPGQRFVLDHLGKPPVKTGGFSPWREQIRELAKSQNVMCKVSGLVTEADHASWQPADLRPYLDVAFEAFGEERLMFGSDWPVCLLAGTYQRVFSVVNEYAAGLTPLARSRLFGDNARRFYGLDRDAK
ncbi:MAG TPA: amidohydrolase family protein [Chthoniobacteraceae bacterium]|nr:amidohydrolase family protein [Chthoniobacteraceae bacterium]